jgi:hypothetical protein
MSGKGEISYSEFCIAAKWLASVSERVGDGWIWNDCTISVGVSQFYLSRKVYKQLWLCEEAMTDKLYLLDCCEEIDEDDCSCLYNVSGCQVELGSGCLTCVSLTGTDVPHSETCVPQIRTSVSQTGNTGSCVEWSSTDVSNSTSLANYKRSLCTCSIEHHILYSHSYSVPVVYFNIYRPGGELVSYKQLWHCTVESTGQNYAQSDLWTVVTQQNCQLMPVVRNIQYLNVLTSIYILVIQLTS